MEVRMRKISRKVCVLLVVVFFVGILGPVTESRGKLTNSLIEEKEKEIKEAQQQMQTLKNGKAQVQTILKNLEGKKSNLEEYIHAIDQSMMDLEDEINTLSEEIEVQQELVLRVRQELQEAIAKQEKQYEDMKLRIQFMYENGTNLYMDILFSSKNFSELLTRAEYISSMTDYDHNMLEEYRQITNLIEVTKLGLEAQEQLLEQQMIVLEQEKEDLQALQDAKTQEMEQMNSDIRTAEQQIKDYQDELTAMSSTIETLEAEIAAEKKRLLEENGQIQKYDGGKFLWPLAKYTRVTSDYGYRPHPTLGVQLFHNGVDIASPHGTAIYAAYNGKVVAASYTSVMGNYVMIDHGSNIYTVYMHCSKLYVKQGDVVVAGETIAAVGTTGRSTGNHLHFSVRVNGSYVSPWNYIKEP